MSERISPSPRSPSMPSDPLVGMPAHALAAAIRRKDVSCVETMRAYLTHIERVNGDVNAIVALREPDVLLAEAAQKDAALARGEYAGWLHGMPQAPKDLAMTKGIVTTLGSPIFRTMTPSVDAIVVERMRAAGAVFIGKTNTPEFGLGSHTFNEVYGATRNPYDLTKSAGGSSGADAACRRRKRLRRLAAQSGRVLQRLRISTVARVRAALAEHRRVRPATRHRRADGAHGRRRRATARDSGGL